MGRKPIHKRFAAALVLLIMVPFSWESANACVHAHDTTPDHATAGHGSPSPAGSHGSCHGMSVESEGHHSEDTPSHHGSGGTNCGPNNAENPDSCCSGGCCVSVGVPLEGAPGLDWKAPGRDQLIGSPSPHLSGEFPALFRPPIG